MTDASVFLDVAKGWVADNKAQLSQQGIDIAMTISDGNAGGGDGAGPSVTVYAQTQSPDLFDDTASTEGFVELTSRATISANGQWHAEVLEAETADTIHEEKRALGLTEDIGLLLNKFVEFLKEHSFARTA